MIPPTSPPARPGPIPDPAPPPRAAPGPCWLARSMTGEAPATVDSRIVLPDASGRTMRESTVAGASPVIDRASQQGPGAARGGGAGSGIGPGLAGGLVGGIIGGLQAPPPPAPGQPPAAIGQPLADLFEYHVQDPVTIQRNQSALVPILNEAVDAERVSIWRPLLPDNRPLRGLWITNTTGLT